MPSLYMNGRNYTGSGSGEGGGNVYGAFIDTNRVIQATKTVEQGTTDTYTATEDCFVIGGLIVAGGRASNMYVNGIAVSSLFLASGNTSAIQWIMLKRGDVLLFESGNNSSFYTVFGLTFGTQNIFTPQIYSTEERCVGVWKDNKPLYAKTWDINVTIPSGGSWLNTGVDISYVDALVSSVIGNGGAIWGNASAINNAGTLNLVNLGSGSLGVTSVTLYYTKITDTPGSGSYNTLGVPMVHYSTSEQVVGTDEAGNTVYEITKNNISITALSTWISTGISFNGDVISVDGVMTRDGEPIPLGIFNTSVYSTWIYRDGQIKVQQVGNSNETYTCKRITVRYTKSSS